MTAPARPSAARLRRSGRTDTVDGLWAMLPWLVGIVPFGLVVGMTAGANDLSPVLDVLTGTTIYSGSAQFTATGLLGAGTRRWRWSPACW